MRPKSAPSSAPSSVPVTIPAAARLRAAGRPFFGTLHLILALAFGLPIALLGLTGSLLIYRAEIEAVMVPQLLRAAPAAPSAPLVPLPTVVETAKAACPPEALPVRARQLFVAEAPGCVHEVDLTGSGGGAWHVFVDPTTGTVTGIRQGEYDTPLAPIAALHTHLLGLGGERGEHLIGWSGLALFALSLSGLYLWWPVRLRQVPERARLPRSLSGPRALLEWHRSVGFWASAVLALVALTGASLVFKDQTTSFFSALTRTPPAAKAPRVTPADGNALALPLADLLARADNALPGGTIRRVTFPAKPGTPFLVRKWFPGNAHPNGVSYIYLDPNTGAVLRVDAAARANAGRRLMNARYPLHIGRWGGPLTRPLHVAVGLAPTLLLISGVRMWLRRRRRRRA